MEPGDVGALDSTAALADTNPGWLCLMCQAPTEQADVCCSLACVQAAQRELQRNVTRLRLLARRLAPPDARRRVAERNGRLSSALLRWRPEPATVSEAG
jgi:predicted nucleic acid-binding Zn ribbon protein